MNVNRTKMNLSLTPIILAHREDTKSYSMHNFDFPL